MLPPPPPSAQGQQAEPRIIGQRQTAPVAPIPPVALLSLEYPGIVAPNATSIGRAVSTLGGPRHVGALLASETDVAELNYGRTSEEAAVECRWRHPVLGTLVDGDKLVLRVRKRRKVRLVPGENGAAVKVKLDEGEYTQEMVGPVAKILRFRNLGDFQHRPAQDTEQAKLTTALAALDYKTLANYEYPVENEAYYARKLQPDDMDMDTDDQPPPRGGPDDELTPENAVSLCDMFAPGRFTFQNIVHKWNYQLPSTASLTTREGTDEPRYVNKLRNKLPPVTALKFEDTGEIPRELERAPKLASDERAFVDRLKQLFADPGTDPHILSRPVWSRAALVNQFPPAQRVIDQIKALAPHCCYLFRDGPFKDMLVRFGYDPRIQPEAKIYQGVHLRMTERVDRGRMLLKGKINTARAEGKLTSLYKPVEVTEGGDRTKTHIFDGQKLHREYCNYQLCDISDVELSELIHDPEGTVDVCRLEDGWYDSIHLALVREVLRRKFEHLRDEGRPLPPGSIDDLLNSPTKQESDTDSDEEGGRGARRNRPKGKRANPEADEEEAQFTDEEGDDETTRLAKRLARAAAKGKGRASMVGGSEQLLSASGSPAPWTEGGSPVIQGGDGEGDGEVTAVDSESTTTSAVRSKIKSKPKSKPRRGGRKKKLTEDEQLAERLRREIAAEGTE